MAIGTLGPIVFNSSSDKIQTFEEYSSEKTSRIATHENLLNKPIVEFIGPELDRLSLKITWSIEGKINPVEEINKLEGIQEKGQVIVFFLGGKPVGQGKYLIESISRENRRIDNKGNILSISFNINLIEYPENIRKESKIAQRVTPAKTTTTKKTTSKKTAKKATTKKTVTKQKYKYKMEHGDDGVSSYRYKMTHKDDGVR